MIHNTYILIDLEYCYNGMRKGTPRPTHTDNRQIVQIAAVKFDMSKGEIIDTFDQIVQPTYENEVGDFFTELTGITQKQVDEGITLLEALEKLEVFIGNLPVLTYDKDWFVLRQNAQYIKYQPTIIARPFVRIKHLLHLYDIDSTCYSSGTLYKAVGIKMEGHVHNALHDVKSMSQSLYVLQIRSGLSIDRANLIANAQSTDEYAVVGQYSQ